MSYSPSKKSPLQWAADLERICKGNSPLLGWAASLVYARYFGNTTRTNMERQFCPLRRQMELYRPDHQLTDEDLKPVLIAAGCDPKYVARLIMADTADQDKKDQSAEVTAGGAR